MDHNKIQNILLPYVDGSLEEAERREVDKHLPQCPHCSKKLAMLYKIWNNETVIERFEPSPFLWTKIQASIEGNNDQRVAWKVKTHQFSQAFAISVLIVTLCSAFIVGNLLSNGTIGTAQQNQVIAQNDYITKTYHLDSFELFSEESIGQAITITSDLNK